MCHASCSDDTDDGGEWRKAADTERDADMAVSSYFSDDRRGTANAVSVLGTFFSRVAENALGGRADAERFGSPLERVGIVEWGLLEG